MSGAPAQAIGPYRVVGLLGTGATARVLRAVDATTGRELAVKWLHPQAAGDPRVTRHFAAEVALGARLSHTGLVAVLDQGEQDGAAWVALELVEGRSLQDVLRDGALDWRRAAALFIELAGVLGYLHDEAIVHRDIKPANIVIEGSGSGRVRLLDLGIAIEVDVEASSTSFGRAGTPRYMSPEQVAGRPVTPASDLYALGVCLFEALTGASPYEADSEAALLAAHMHAPHRRIAGFVSAPPGLEAVVALCLSKEPTHRYESAADLAGDLRAIVEQPETPAAETLAGRKLGLRRLRGDLLGRSREMAAVARWLGVLPSRRGRGRVLVLAGDRGSGKSALLHWARGRALELGYRPADGAAGGGDLEVVDDLGSLRPSRAGCDLLAAAVAGADLASAERVVELGPLGRGSVRSWLRDDLGLERLDERDLDFVLEVSSGVPGRIEPLLVRWRTLKRRGSAPAPGSLATILEVTAEEREGTLQLLRILGQDERLLLELAAWLEPCPVEVADLLAIVGLGESDLGPLVASYLKAGLGVVFDRERLGFRDAVLARIVREGTDPAALPDLLGEAVALLEPRPEGAALARRADLTARLGRQAEAARVGLEAAARLGQEHQHWQAAETCERWLPVSGAALDTSQAELVSAAVKTLAQAGQGERALALLKTALGRADDELGTRLRLEQGSILWREGRLAEARTVYLGVALAARRSGRMSLRFRALANVGSVEWVSGRPRRSRALLEALAPLASEVDDALRVAWLRSRALQAVTGGEHAEAQRLLDEAWRIARAGELKAELVGLAEETALVLRRTGDLARAVAAEEGLALARELRDDERVAYLLHLMGSLELHAARPAQAARRIRASVRLCHRVGSRYLLANNYELLTRIEAAAGRIAEARRCIRLARRHATQDDTLEAYLRIAEADLALIEGDAAAARERLDAAGALEAALDDEGRLFYDVIEGLLTAAEGGDPTGARLSRLRASRKTSGFGFRLEELEARLARALE